MSLIKRNDLTTAVGLRAEAKRWQGIADDTPPGDPAKRISERNAEYFLAEAAKLDGQS